MTNFDKEKALVEAKRRYLDYLTDTHIELRDAFIKGARWQAEQPIVITDKMVERGVTVYRNNEHYFDDYDTLRIALKAALGVSNE